MVKAIPFVVTAAMAALLASPAMAARYDAKAVELRNITGEVQIVTNAGDDVEVTIEQGKVHRSIDVSVVDGVVVLAAEGRPAVDWHDQHNHIITRTISRRSDRRNRPSRTPDDAFFADYPVIKITMPRAGDVDLYDVQVKLDMDSLDGAFNLDASYVYGEAGSLGEAVINILSGSRLVVGDVKSALEVDVAGAAAFRAGDAAMVDVDIAGNGDVSLGTVDGMLDVSIAGSGLTRVGRADGPVTARIAGSGALAVQSGNADPLRVNIDGSGSVYFEGAASSPDLRLFGSSEVRLGSVKGRIARAGGSGKVYVGGRALDE